MRKTFRNNRELARLFKTKGKNFKSISQKDFDEATKNSSVEEKALANGYMIAINSSEVHEVQIRNLNAKVTIDGKKVDAESFNTNQLGGSGGGNRRTSTGSFTIILRGSSLSAPPDIINNTTGNYITNRKRNLGRVLAHELLGHGLDRFLGGDSDLSHKINPVRVDNLFLRHQNNGSSRVYRNGGAHGPFRGIIPGTISWQVPLYLR